MAALEDAGRASHSVANATHELYRQYGKQIYAYCLHQLRNREEAEDAVQTVFLNAFRGLQRGTTTRFEQAWLYKIAQNVCIARRSSSGRRLRVEAPDDFEILEELVPSGASAGDGDTLELMGLDEALDSMPENQRRAILLREWQGLSYREIASELGLSQGAVEMLIFRARRTLAMALEQPDVAEKRRTGRTKTGFSFGSLIAAMKSLFSGGAVVKMAAIAMSAAVVGTNAIHSIVQPAARTKTHRAAPAPVVHVQSTTPVGASATLRPRMHLVAYRAHKAAVVRPIVSRWVPSHHAPVVAEDPVAPSAPAASSSQTSTPAPAAASTAAPVTHTAAPAASPSGSGAGSSSEGPSVGGGTASGSPSDTPTGTSSAASNAGSGSAGSTTTSAGLDITGTSAVHDGHAGGRTTTGSGTDTSGTDSSGTSQSGDTSGSGDGTTTTATTDTTPATSTPTPTQTPAPSTPTPAPTPSPAPPTPATPPTPAPTPPPPTADGGQNGAPPSAPASSPDPATPPASPAPGGDGSAAPASGAARSGHGHLGH